MGFIHVVFPLLLTVEFVCIEDVHILCLYSIAVYTPGQAFEMQNTVNISLCYLLLYFCIRDYKVHVGL